MQQAETPGLFRGREARFSTVTKCLDDKSTNIVLEKQLDNTYEELLKSIYISKERYPKEINSNLNTLNHEDVITVVKKETDHFRQNNLRECVYSLYVVYVCVCVYIWREGCRSRYKGNVTECS